MSIINPAQYYFDLVKTHLKDTKVIILRTLHWSRLRNDSVIDLTGFTKLKSFTYLTGYSEYDRDDRDNDDDQGNVDNQSNNVVLLKYTNGEEQCYYLDEEKRKNAQLEYSKNPTIPRLTSSQSIEPLDLKNSE
ncbi:hypothetical protein HPULCUR_007547 [Helicostylum pulchrum]|uniref:Uncharacterized protein n=1 Tax=Helicostylum pulchrum TaxID=562976 RepID=A0ABP9Y6Y7_9FUNG